MIEGVSLVDVVLSRRSIRRYTTKEIGEDVLDKILEAGRQAPSAGNRQPWHFILITDDEIKEELSKGVYTWFIKDSLAVIAGCAKTEVRKWSVVDTSIAMQNMVIAAWAMGVGSCWIGAFKEEDVKQLLSIPEGWKVVALIAFGYPAEGENRFPKNFQKSRDRLSKKKPIEEIVSRNKF